MFYSIKNLFNIFDNINFRIPFSLIFFIIFNSFVEVIGFGLLIPIIGIIADENFYQQFMIFIQQINFIDISFLYNLTKINFINLFILFTLIVFFLKFIINLYFNFYVYELKKKIELKLSQSLLESISKSENFFYLENATSKLVNNITSRCTGVTTALVNIIYFFSELIVFLIISSVISVLYIYEAITIAFILTSIFGIYYLTYKNLIANWSKLRALSGDKRINSLINFFQGIRELIIYSKFEYLKKEFSKNNEIFLNQMKKINLLNIIPKITLELFFVTLILSVIIFQVNRNFNNENLLFSLSLFVVVLIRMMPSINRMIFNFNQFKYSNENIITLNKFLMSSLSKVSSNETISFKNSIELKRINFSYNKEKTIFENLNFKIEKNKKIGLVGEVGLGKSTLLDLIAGFLLPQSGKIFADEKNIAEFNINNWLKNICFISQKSFIFENSIRHNITFSNDDQKIDEIKFKDVIKKFKLEDLINQNPEKEFFNLGENGKNISGGQRQKIALARALYSTRDFFILDEATNAMDEKNELEIINELLRLKNKTIIFVTHKKNNLINFDEIFKISSSTINKLSL